jgi:hypothetical protein
MTGELDLNVLLTSMTPVLATGQYGFASLPPDSTVPEGICPIGTFVEPEGLTLIAERQAIEAAGLAAEGVWALITLEVHSSLEAIGFMAAIAGALARRRISVNVFSAFFHDHLLVPWHVREAALECLLSLSRTAAGGSSVR